MANAHFQVPIAFNEPVHSYEKGSLEREKLIAAINELKGKQTDIPMFIGGKEIRANNLRSLHPPHEINHKLGDCHYGDASHVKMAIDSALQARKEWEALPWEQRASIFLKAAELIAGPYRYETNAATMLAQSKNAFQSEIDAVCELIDFYRYNVQFASEIYADQPESAEGIWNRMEYRGLEGFVLAIAPFNFSSISVNLAFSAALMGNVVVWKPSDTQIYSAWYSMKILREAGLPDGVINLVYADGPTVGDTCLASPDLAGIHFTGSTATFQHLWKQVGNNIANYKTYPRLVGETGGKDFVIAHKSANPSEVATALSRGAFEFQGQKCSAASRAYIPDNLWRAVKEHLKKDVSSFKMGSVEDFGNFVNAVIDERSFDRIARYIDNAKDASGVEIIVGGNYDKSKGYFIEPTVIVVDDPHYTTMCEEIFGPVLTIYVYPENDFEQILKIADNTSAYALTGAVFAKDRYALNLASERLKYSAGNFYLNDKPTGAVVGQQPFGGARASGTNDKAGSKFNLLRWTSPRTIKETLVPPKDYRYPFLDQ